MLIAVILLLTICSISLCINIKVTSKKQKKDLYVASMGALAFMYSTIIVHLVNFNPKEVVVFSLLWVASVPLYFIWVDLDEGHFIKLFIATLPINSIVVLILLYSKEFSVFIGDKIGFEIPYYLYSLSLPFSSCAVVLLYYYVFYGKGKT